MSIYKMDSLTIVHNALINYLKKENVDLQDTDVVKFYRYFLFKYYMNNFIKEYRLKDFITIDNEKKCINTLETLFIYILKEKPENLTNVTIGKVKCGILSYDMNYEPEPTMLEFLPEDFLEKLYHLTLQLKMMILNDKLLQQTFRNINLNFDSKQFFQDIPKPYFYSLDDVYLSKVMKTLGKDLVIYNNLPTKFIPVVHNFLQKVIYGKLSADII